MRAGRRIFANMRASLLVFLLGLLSFFQAAAEPSDTTRYKIGLINTGIYNHTEVTETYTLSNTLRLGIKGRLTELDATANYTYGETNNELVNNDVTANIAGNRYVFANRRFYLWGLGTYESSFSLGVASRTQLGAGIAWSALDSPRAYLNFSEGILVETSNIQEEDGSTTTSQTLRNSFRLRFRFATPNDRFLLESTSSIQNSLKDFGDYILRSNTSFTVKVWKNIGLTAAAVYNRVSATDRENLLLTLGFKAEYQF